MATPLSTPSRGVHPSVERRAGRALHPAADLRRRAPTRQPGPPGRGRPGPRHQPHPRPRSADRARARGLGHHRDAPRRLRHRARRAGRARPLRALRPGLRVRGRAGRAAIGRRAGRRRSRRILQRAAADRRPDRDRPAHARVPRPGRRRGPVAAHPRGAAVDVAAHPRQLLRAGARRGRLREAGLRRHRAGRRQARRRAGRGRVRPHHAGPGRPGRARCSQGRGLLDPPDRREPRTRGPHRPPEPRSAT